MHRKSLAIILAVIIIGGAIAAAVYSSIAGLQTETEQLKNQNRELQAQNSTLQTQLSELRLQNKEQQDRLNDYTYQLSLERKLYVEITQAKASRGGSPIVGVTLSHPVNVTILNHDVVPLYGLVAAFNYVHKDSGVKIGDGGQAAIERIDVGENKTVSGSVYITLGTNLDDAVCRITLLSGSTVLDEWTQEVA